MIAWVAETLANAGTAAVTRAAEANMVIAERRNAFFIKLSS
jgi:hypothetical protein